MPQRILRVTFGPSKDQPQGQPQEFESFEDFIAALREHAKLKGRWFSQHEFKDSYRTQDRWLSSDLMLADVDYYDAAGKHAPVPEAERAVIEQLVKDMPHEPTWYWTTRGVRLGFRLSRTCTDREQWVAAMNTLCAYLARRLEGSGFRVDVKASCDLARFYWTPPADVIWHVGPLLGIEQIAALLPRQALVAAALTFEEFARGREQGFEQAVERYRHEHPLRGIPDNSGTCPVCAHNGCFGRLRNEDGSYDRQHWFCFSDAHGADSNADLDSRGHHSANGWMGDQLDLDAYEQGKTRRALLQELGYLNHRVGTNATEKRKAPRQPSIIEKLWKPMSAEILEKEPPRREYLLHHPVDPSNPALSGRGFAPTGITSVIASEGGVGKTNLLLQLAVAIITGRPWLQHFVVDRERVGGRVLLVLAEEKDVEVWRRLDVISRYLGLRSEERALVRERLMWLALAGRPCPLIELDPETRQPRTTRHFEVLQMLLDVNGPWAFIGLDPLARLFPPAEKDTELATYGVQVLEQLTEAPGEPLVTLSHHSSKFARRAGVVDTRGSTSLPDGVRWTLLLQPKGDLVELRQGKANYAAPMLEPLLLGREPDHGGLLRSVTPQEMLMLKQQDINLDMGQLEEDVRKLVQNLRDQGPAAGYKVLSRRCGMRQKTCADALSVACTRGLTVQEGTYKKPVIRALFPEDLLS